ncbi:MAG: MerR family DNA-binding protein [Gammaproteobacteria bacterium]|nr:MerR family DNA-binding protein [Gammaproteobacteria bacterium]
MMTRGKLARKTGCHIETIRYYEKVGLMPEPQRTDSGYRIYDGSAVPRLRFIQRSKSLGFTLDRIREFLDLSDHSEDHTRAEVKVLTQVHIEEIGRKIKDLQRIQEQLTLIASHCDGSSQSAEKCPILLSLFEADNEVEPSSIEGG